MISWPQTVRWRVLFLTFFMVFTQGCGESVEQLIDRDNKYLSTLPVAAPIENTLTEEQRKEFEFFTMLVPESAETTNFAVSLNGQCKLSVVVDPDPWKDLSIVAEKMLPTLTKLDPNVTKARANVAGRGGIVFSLTRKDPATGKNKVQKAFLTTCDHDASMEGMHVVVVSAVVDEDVAAQYSGLVDEMVQSIKVAVF
jgi:hypothetical protein